METIERNETTSSSKLAKDISTSHNSKQPDAVDEDETYSRITLGTEPTASESEQRVIGVNWNFVEDQLVFDLSGIAELPKTSEPTKRNIIRLPAKFYDPLGYMSPITVQFKQIFQELCEEDFEEPLTPSHLLIGRRLSSLPEPNYNEDDTHFDIKLDTDDLSRRMRHLSNVMNHFWSRWRNEYLKELGESHRVEKRNENETVSLGDIVVIYEESRPRGLWK
ncbi:Hypothetical predicted protein, partial [Paramuricea clavata]